MPLERNRVDYLPIIDRPVIEVANDARVAALDRFTPNVEHYEYLPENEGVRNPWPRDPVSECAAVLAYGTTETALDSGGCWTLGQIRNQVAASR